MEKILVVEDEEQIREFICEILQGWGYETETAENGKIGLEKFRSRNFAMVVTDMRMPVMDGLTMLKTIRKEDANIPIIVVTAYPSVDSAVESLVEGADYYLVKPINVDDLKVKIYKAFEKKRIQTILTSRKNRNLIMTLLIPVWIIIGYLLSNLLK